MSTYSARWKGDPLQFRFFPLSPDPEDKQGHEVLFDPVDQGRSFIPQHRAMIWICSPYLTGEAFDWLTIAIPPRQKHDVYIITSEINNPASGTHAINQWAKTVCAHTSGAFNLTIYPGFGKKRISAVTGACEPLMHSKIYVCVSGKSDRAFIDPPKGGQVISGFFGSMNFTGSGLGYKDTQSFELLCQASDDDAKSRLAEEFHFLWSYSNVSRWVFDKKKRTLKSKRVAPVRKREASAFQIQTPL